MKRTFIGFLALFAFASVCFAQHNEGRVILKSGTEFSVELMKTIDAEKAKSSDLFQMQTVEDMPGAGILKGTVLYGRVADAKPMGANGGVSEITLFFDFLKKDEEFLSLNAKVISFGKMVEAEEARLKEVSFTASKTIDGWTILSMKGKNLRLDEGSVFRLKLAEDLLAKK